MNDTTLIALDYYKQRRSPTTAKLTDKLAAWCNRTQFQLTVKVIYPKYYKVGFPTGQDTKTFGDKGTMGQAENLTKGRDGPEQPKFGTGGTGRDS